MGGGASRWRTAGKRLCFACTAAAESPPPPSLKANSSSGVPNIVDATEDAGRSCRGSKSICAICLDSLNNDDAGDGEEGEQRIYTAQCAHSFHFVCIASNLRHGNYTCPICRAYWSHLPHHLTTFSRPHSNSDPVLRILDDSIASSRVNRRSSHRSATRYDDDDPIADTTTPSHPRLHLALSRSVLSVKLSHPQAADVVLIVSPNGPHLRLLKQSMAVVVFSLRAIDRLTIVTCSITTTTRALPLRRMTPDGKRLALHVIDRLYYGHDTDPTEGIKKGVKILEDRMHRNPLSYIIHISDNPTRGCEVESPMAIHRFYVWNGLVMHEFEDFLLRMLGGAVKEVQLRVGEEGGLIRLGELRVREEKRVPVDMMRESGYICISYRYIEGVGVEERVATEEVAVRIGEKPECTDDGSCDEGGGRRSSSSVERWDYLDPFVARRRWAKRLHGYKT